MPPKLTPNQKERLARLEPQLKIAVPEKKIEEAKRIVGDIQDLLRTTGHITKLIQIKNWLFELAIEVGEYYYAEQGFIGNRKLVNKNTRIHLEATALLAICYLRMNEYERAKPFIQEVLKNSRVITSENSRREFHRNIIQRFDEEAALFSLKMKSDEHLDADEIQTHAAKVMMENNEEQIYTIIGRSLPIQTKNILLQIDNFAKKSIAIRRKETSTFIGRCNQRSGSR